MRERDVLGHGQRLEQREVLEHHADAEPPRGGRIGDGDRLALPADLAGGRLQRAVDDLHQRRLAGAVLAEQRVDLAGRDGEIDVVVGAQRAEILDDAQRLQQVGSRAAPSRSRRLPRSAPVMSDAHRLLPRRCAGMPAVRHGRSQRLVAHAAAPPPSPRRSPPAPWSGCPAMPIGQTRPRDARLGRCPPRAAALEARALGARCRSGRHRGSGRPRSARVDDGEIERMAVGHHQDEAAAPARSASSLHRACGCDASCDIRRHGARERRRAADRSR